jgi:putative transposase
VRAGLVRRPRDYPWSSYRRNAEAESGGPATAHKRYLALGADPAARAAAYRALCHASLDPALVDEIRLATNGGFVLGNRRFQAEIARMLGRRVARGHPGRPAKKGASGGEE